MTTTTTLKPIASHVSAKVTPTRTVQGYNEATQSGDVSGATLGTKRTHQKWTEDNDY